MLHAYEYGDKGDWIVCLHGIGGSSSVFYKQVKELRKRYRLFVVDLPSHGKSGDIEGNKWSIKRCVEMIEDLVKEKGIINFHVIGFSLGTLIVHEWLKKENSGIKSAILIGAVTDFHWTGKILIMLGRIVRYFIPLKWMYKWCAYILLPNKSQKESRDMFIEESKKVKEKEFRKWFYVFDEVGKIYNKDCMKEIPKLYISGDQDYMFIKDLERKIKEDKWATLKLIEGAGHACHLQKSKECNELIMRFLDEISKNNEKAYSIP